MFNIIYIGILYFTFFHFFKDIKLREYFTRIVSTINALQCIRLTYLTLQIRPIGNISDLYYVADEQFLDSLFLFSSYLFIDGIFLFSDFQYNFSFLLSVLHHFVGSIGIYLIASNRMGYFLGFYFAMTELSTPLLNLSWVFRKKYLFLSFYVSFIFCRILTIPLLLVYLSNNSSSLYTLHPLHSFMSFYGSYTLIFLNVVWFLLITKKIVLKFYE